VVYTEKDNVNKDPWRDWTIVGPMTDTQYTATGLSPKTKYYWMVFAYDPMGALTPSTEVRWFYTSLVVDSERNDAVKAVLNELDGTAYGSFNETTGFDGTTFTATITNVATGTTVKDLFDALETVVKNNEEFLFPVTLGNGNFPGIDLTGTYATLDALKAKLEDTGLFSGTKLSAALNDGSGATTVVTFDIHGVTYTFNVVNQ
jgi:hypothetical protein